MYLSSQSGSGVYGPQTASAYQMSDQCHIRIESPAQRMEPPYQIINIAPNTVAPVYTEGNVANLRSSFPNLLDELDKLIINNQKCATAVLTSDNKAKIYIDLLALKNTKTGVAIDRVKKIISNLNISNDSVQIAISVSEDSYLFDLMKASKYSPIVDEGIYFSTDANSGILTYNKGPKCNARVVVIDKYTLNRIKFMRCYERFHCNIVVPAIAIGTCVLLLCGVYIQSAVYYGK